MAESPSALRKFVPQAWLVALKSIFTLPLTDPRAMAAAVPLVMLLMLSVAIGNGFPIIFYDTGAYLLEGLGRVFLPERSPVYSLLLDYAGAGRSLWLIAVLQAAATSIIVILTARTVFPRLTLLALAGLGVALALLTGAPWYVGQIEPDCFAALTVLSLYLLAFRAGAFPGWQRAILLAVATLSVAVHPSHLIVGAGLVAAVALYAMLRKAVRLSAWPAPRVAAPFATCVAGLLLVVAANHQLTGKYFVTRSGSTFVFSRLLQDGIVMRLLDDTCPEAHYRLCAYKDFMPRTADQWLWNTSSPFFAMNRFTGTREESARIIWDSLKRYPGMHLKAAISDTVRQFAMFETGDQIEPQEWVLSRPLAQFIPAQMQSYLSARQQASGFDFRSINFVHVPIGWLSILGLMAALIAALGRGRRETAIFASFILVALLANAAVCGTLSNPHNRYQSRLVWLAPFALALITGDRAIFALRGVRESGS